MFKDELISELEEHSYDLWQMSQNLDELIDELKVSELTDPKEIIKFTKDWLDSFGNNIQSEDFDDGIKIDSYSTSWVEVHEESRKSA